MYEKNGKVYLDENEYLNESYEVERNLRIRRNNMLSCFITAILIILVFLIPLLLWMRDFREQHPRHPEESQTVTEVTTCTSN